MAGKLDLVILKSCGLVRAPYGSGRHDSSGQPIANEPVIGRAELIANAGQAVPGHAWTSPELGPRVGRVLTARPGPPEARAQEGRVLTTRQPSGLAFTSRSPFRRPPIAPLLLDPLPKLLPGLPQNGHLQ